MKRKGSTNKIKFLVPFILLLMLVVVALTQCAVPAVDVDTEAETIDRSFLDQLLGETDATSEPYVDETEKESEVTAKAPEETTNSPEEPTAKATMVWIPTKGGTKYHSKSSCSSMDSHVRNDRPSQESRIFRLREMLQLKKPLCSV